jgi:hypothetical protein
MGLGTTARNRKCNAHGSRSDMPAAVTPDIEVAIEANARAVMRVPNEYSETSTETGSIRSERCCQAFEAHEIDHRFHFALLVVIEAGNQRQRRVFEPSALLVSTWAIGPMPALATFISRALGTYETMRSAVSTAGHNNSWAGVSLSRCLMPAIWASLSTLPGRLETGFWALGSVTAACSPPEHVPRMFITI